MPFIEPMLAHIHPTGTSKFQHLVNSWPLDPDTFAVEEKWDGHRLEIEITDGQADLFTPKHVNNWSRYGISRVLPTHIVDAASRLPNCHLDGELIVPGKRSYGVTELTNSPDLVYICFDIFSLEGDQIWDLPYDNRRDVLRQIFNFTKSDFAVQLAASTNVNTWGEVLALRDAVWWRDGEGLILKRRSAPYQPGKRSKDFLKIKNKRNKTMTIVGFSASRGTIVNRGRFAITLCEDEKGTITPVKTKNDAECAKLEQEWEQFGRPERHPAVGRKLLVEYQESTPDGSYRHPRWDRWSDE